MLPSDRYLASLIGLTDEEYQYFKEYVEKESAKAPQPAVVCGLETATIIAIAQLVIGTGLLVASALLRPKPKSNDGKQGQPKQSNVDGKQIVRNTDFAPKYGFDSTQGVTTLGGTIPLIYTKREALFDGNFGGLRVNLPLLWSQTLSLYGGQMFRGVFLLGEASIEEIQTDNYAIGSSLIQNFYFNNLNVNELASRATVYESLSGGRIENRHRVLGRTPANDPGNGSDTNANGGDVYQVYRNNQYRTDFCASYVPNSQTVFGVFSPIGNAMVYRVNPTIQPGVRSVYTTADPERITVECPSDGQQLNLRDKYRCRFVTRSGILENGTGGTPAGGQYGPGGNPNSELRLFAVNDNIKYRLFSTSELMPTSSSDGFPDYNNQTVFDFYQKETGDEQDFDINNANAEAYCDDVAQTVAGMQSNWDDSLIEGEKYKIGTALAVCYKRDPNRFKSTADRAVNNSNNVDQNSVSAEFKVIESGVAGVYSSTVLQAQSTLDDTNEGTDMRVVATGGWNGTNNSNTDYFIGGHLLRYAEAFITSSRPVNAIELSIRSSVGIRVAGLCNFPTAKGHSFVDKAYCEPFANTEAEDVHSNRHTSDTITTAVERYSFFKVQYRVGDTNWATFNAYIGVKGETQQNQYNYIRIESLLSEQTISVKLVPVSGFEIRYQAQAIGNIDPMYILNSNFDADDRDANAENIADARAVLAFHGEEVNLNREPFTFWLGKNEHDLELSRESYEYNWKKSSEDGSTWNTVTLKGLPYTEQGNYVDKYGKLAEMFPYKEITSSAEGGPEHEVVAVNEIVRNRNNAGQGFVPQYDSMALVGLNIQSSTEFTQLPQFSAYVTKGVKVKPLTEQGGTDIENRTNVTTHLFPEILLDLMVTNRYGTGKYITYDMVDLGSFAGAAGFCLANRYFFDGAMAETVNLRTWAADTASMMLLQFGERQGKFFLQPAFPTAANVPVDIADQFSAGNILENTFNLQYLDPEDRLPIEVSVTYREENENDSEEGAKFPVTRELRVEERNQNAVELESIDMSGFCTSREHAIDVAKYMILARRLTDHMIKFKTTHEAALTSLNPGDYIRVAMESTSYGMFNNGVVGLDGTITSTLPFEPGTYAIIGWMGEEGVEPAPMDLVVNEDGTSDQFGLIFTVPNTVTQTKTYLIERITSEEDGAFSIEASHAPTNNNGVLLMTQYFNTDDRWRVKP